MRYLRDYCKCKDRESVTSGFEDDFGYWIICTTCGKPLEGEYHFYNHYDGNDHEEFWDINGDIYTNEDD